MPTSAPFLACRSLSKRYGDGPVVLEGIEFSAERGEFISIIGPSGCGKSTLLRLIAGLATPGAGSLTIVGRPPAQTAEPLACVFQDATLLPWLDVAANVELPLTLQKTPAARRAELRTRALALVRLAEKASAYPRELSGGQKMRVSLARALTLSPSVLLLDEPFGALDEMTRHRLNEELLAIHARQPCTAFFVTHSVAEAVFLSHRILVLSAHPGRLHRDLVINLPFPRDAATRESPAYLQLVASVTHELRAVSPA
jgi:NitT/TauT family transport system ATP-binding protein